MKLLSLEFAGLALAACVLLPVLKGPLRGVVFLVLNAAFAASFLTPVGQVSTGAFLLLGYGVARGVRGGGTRRVVAGVALLTATFVYLRGYDLVRLALPAGFVHDVLATAGLSFLFFKILHVVLDNAAGTLGELRPGIYVNYCLNFTTFLMGPIQRYQDFHEQWTGRRGSIEPGFEGHLGAVARIARGLVKKYVLAEFLAYETLYPGMDFGAFTVPQLVVKMYVFYAYLYCDFSGYCDVVIGTGSLMGIRPPENFRFPFLSRNVAEYWLRVHRTLTAWLTDYVFNPVYAALLRTGWARGRTLAPLAIALVLTMLVSGVWHGTTLAFVCFGLLHAVFLVSHRAYEHLMKGAMGVKRFRAFSANRAVHAAAVLVTWNVTSVAYVFFVLGMDDVARLTRRIVGA